MAPEIQSVVRATQAWLQSSWHVRVPFAWLEACVGWLQDEAGGAGRLSQQQINQQALDQWLQTDLRDLDHAVLPERLSQSQKTELNGTFCVQVDSLLDISQPAYGQLQKLKGTDCANDEVSAVTQATQRPWEARPTRLLLLQLLHQHPNSLKCRELVSALADIFFPAIPSVTTIDSEMVTDGVQSLEAMEYQSIPELSTALRPGAKLQLRGQMVCRLGVLLLGPSNIKVLGGEVEDLADRNNQGRVLCRTLGLPEEEQQQQEVEAPPAPQQGVQEEEDLELDDAELLASLEAQEEVERVQVRPVQDSGYRTLSEISTQSSRSSPVRSFVSTVSSRSGLTQGDRGASVQGHRHSNELQDNMADEDFPDEDFDDLPMDELDAVMFQESANAADSGRGPQHSNRTTGSPYRAAEPQTAQKSSGSQLGSSSSRSTAQKMDHGSCTRGPTAASPFSPAAASEPPCELEFLANDDFMDEDMDCFIEEVQTGRAGTANQFPVQQGPSDTKKPGTSDSRCRLPNDSLKSVTPRGQSCTSSTAGFDGLSAKKDPQSHSPVPALTLTSPPFTYLRLLDETMSRPLPHTTEIRVKAFIVTLLGNLSGSSGLWHISATISDGTGYLDVELSDEVLTGLLGFSVAEKGALKRDPARRGELDAGMRRCQEGLVDMCCVMTVAVKPDGRKAVVTKAEPVSEKALQELERRASDGRK